MTSKQKLSDQIVRLASDLNGGFLDIARPLRELYDTDADEFQTVVKKIKLGLRKAYYLVGIDNTFGRLPVAKERLEAIGWTKLRLLTTGIDESNYEALLKQAEAHTVKELEQLLQGKDISGSAHVMIFYFSAEDNGLVSEGLVRHGATRSGKSLVGKEDALINLVYSVTGEK